MRKDRHTIRTRITQYYGIHFGIVIEGTLLKVHNLQVSVHKL